MCRVKPIGIIDYGSGNLQSIINALNYLKIPAEIFNNPKDFNSYDKLILPGVGSFEFAIENLKKRGFSKLIIDLVKSKKIKLLGICLGMQLLYDYSEEDNGCDGLGIIKGRVNKINLRNDIRVPNIGWRKINLQKKSDLFSDIEIEPIFYFVHSYGCETFNKNEVTGVLNYGQIFDVVVESDNVFGTQFHPEKSQIAGLQILKNFSNKL